MHIKRDVNAWKDGVSPLSSMSDEDFDRLDAQMSESIEQATYPVPFWQRAPVKRTRTKKEKRNVHHS